MSRSVKIVRAGTELRGGGRATSGQIVHVLDVDADEMVLRGDASELNTISQAIMPTPADGDVLTYVTSDSRWENKPAAGGSDPNPTFDSLHVTGASTLTGTVTIDPPALAGADGLRASESIHGVAMTDARADAWGVPHGSNRSCASARQRSNVHVERRTATRRYGS